MFGREYFEENPLVPFPWLWWNVKAHFGNRTACRHEIHLAETLALGIRGEYCEEMWTGLEQGSTSPIGFLPDGTPIVRELSIFKPVAEVHNEFLRNSMPNLFQLLPDDLARYAERRTPGGWDDGSEDIRHLFCWNLLYWWFSYIFDTCVLDKRFTFDEDLEPLMVRPHAVPSYSLAFANATYWDWQEEEEYTPSPLTHGFALVHQYLHSEFMRVEEIREAGTQERWFGDPPWAHRL